MTAPTLVLGACLQLATGADRITAGDLARAEPAWAALAAETALAYAPSPGVRRTFAAAELQRLAARHGVSLVSPREICVEHMLEPLTPERLLPAMRAALALPEASIEIVEISRYPAPRGELEFPRAALAAPPASQPRSAVLWRGYVRYTAQRRFPIWARVRILARTQRVVATQPLAAGRAIASAALRVETYEGFPMRATAAASIDQVAGKAPRRTIPAGAPVSLDLLEDAREVSRGDTVAVEVASGAAHLQTEARAESDGRRGQTIALRNPSSGKRFAARVTGPGKVVIDK